MAKILVIDDDPSFRQDLSELLEIEGYQVVSAGNGPEGVEQARQHRPDLIICDMRMPPHFDGDVVQVKVREFLGNIPFIFLTGLEVTMTNLNPADYLGKPFHAEVLLEKVVQKLRR